MSLIYRLLKCGAFATVLADLYLIQLHFVTYGFLLDLCGLTIGWYRRLVFLVSACVQFAYAMMILLPRIGSTPASIVATAIVATAIVLIQLGYLRYGHDYRIHWMFEDHLQQAGHLKPLQLLAAYRLFEQAALRCGVLLTGIVFFLIGNAYLGIIGLAVAQSLCVAPRDRDRDRFKKHDFSIAPAAA